MLFGELYCLLNSQAVFWVILGRALGAKPQKLIKTLWNPMCTRDNDNRRARTYTASRRFDSAKIELQPLH